MVRMFRDLPAWMRMKTRMKMRDSRMVEEAGWGLVGVLKGCMSG